MDTERRWVPHYPLSAAAEIVEVETDAHTRARTSELGLLGCYLDALTPLPVGSRIRLQLTHQEGTFTALGSVVHSEPNLGMGIKFTGVELAQQAVLVKWLARFGQSCA